MYLDKLKYVIKDLTPSEEKVVNFISAHLNDLSKYTSNEIAAMAEVSQPTVIRFSQKLGYSSFKQMIKDISYSSENNVNLDVDENETTIETINKIQSQYTEIIQSTAQYNSAADIDAAVDYLYRANNIICFGFSNRNNLFAQYFTERLCSIGLKAISCSHTSNVYSRLNVFTKNDVILLLSESGETRDLINYAKIAQKKGAVVISITRPQANTLASCSNINLKTEEYGLRTFLRNNVMRVSQLFVLDILFLNLVKKDISSFEEKQTLHMIQTKLDYYEE